MRIYVCVCVVSRCLAVKAQLRARLLQAEVLGSFTTASFPERCAAFYLSVSNEGREAASVVRRGHDSHTVNTPTTDATNPRKAAIHDGKSKSQ